MSFYFDRENPISRKLLTGLVTLAIMAFWGYGGTVGIYVLGEALVKRLHWDDYKGGDRIMECWFTGLVALDIIVLFIVAFANIANSYTVGRKIDALENLGERLKPKAKPIPMTWLKKRLRHHPSPLKEIE